MAIEKMRGCGYRKVGGLYLCGSGAGLDCDRLPYELEICPVCGAGVKFTRAWTWLDWLKYAGAHGEMCKDMYSRLHIPGPFCPMCDPVEFSQPYGLLWVGEASYTPQSFIQEALTMGVSRRIPTVPKNLKLGETWVLFAHKHLIEPPDTGEELEDLVARGQKPERLPGVFYAFRPQSLELLVWESDAKPEYIEDLHKRGITPVIIPDDDEDHDPDIKTKMSIDDREEVNTRNRIANLRKSFGG